MGLFDYVHFSMNCPKCGAKVNGFQTKDGHCYLSTVEPDAVDSFYSTCSKCETWIEFRKTPFDPVPAREQALTVEEVLALGFVMKVDETLKS